MKSTLNVKLSQQDANEIAAEMTFIQQQEELLNSRRETLEARKIAFNRLAIGYAKAEGHKVANLLKIELTDIQRPLRG